MPVSGNGMVVPTMEGASKETNVKYVMMPGVGEHMFQGMNPYAMRQAQYMPMPMPVPLTADTKKSHESSTTTAPGTDAESSAPHPPAKVRLNTRRRR